MKRFRPVMGQENEIAFTPIDKNGDPLGRGRYVVALLHAARQLGPYIDGVTAYDTFLGNGGRLYIDAGHHPEWATPECLSPLDVVTWRAAGECILARAATALEMHDPAVGEIVLARISGDYHTGATRGGHESYLVREPLALHATHMVPHLVSRIVFTGAGGFDNTIYGAKFMLSPRVAHLTTTVSGNSTNNRGIFHTRDEPLCRGSYLRMHVLAGENLLSHKADVLRMGTTALVAFAIDKGERPSSPICFVDPLQAMRTFAFDTSCTAQVPLSDGRAIGAIDIQWHHLNMVETYRDHPEFPPWGEMVCSLWRDVLTRLSNDPNSLDGVLDWRIKLACFQSVVERTTMSWDTIQAMSEGPQPGAELSSPGTGAMQREFRMLRDRLCELDVRLCRVGRRSAFARLEKSGVLRHRLVSADLIERAVMDPPSGRAGVRGRAIQMARRHDAKTKRYRAYWTFIDNMSDNLRLDLGDPFMTRGGSWKSIRTRRPTTAGLPR